MFCIYSLPDGKRAELIDGRIYDMAPPNRIHQKLINQFTKVLGHHIKKNNGSCEVYPAPFAVFLNKDAKHTSSRIFPLFVTKTSLITADAMVHRISSSKLCLPPAAKWTIPPKIPYTRMQVSVSTGL